MKAATKTITKEQGDKLLADFMGIEAINVGQFKYRLTNSVYSKIFTRNPLPTIIHTAE